MLKKIPFNIKNLHPLYQGIFIFILISTISISCYLLNIESIHVWNLLISPLFLYCCYNPIIGAFHQKQLQYFIISTIIFVLLGYYIYVSGNYLSTVSFNSALELQSMTALVVLFYILVQVLCLLFRGILFLIDEIDH